MYEWGQRGRLGHGGKPERGLWVRGQSIHSMGLVWIEVYILAQRASSPSKFLFNFLLTTTHVLNILVFIVNVLLCYS